VDVLDVPLSAWCVVAGPPGTTSYDPLQGSKQLSRGIKRRGSTGWIIDCFGCGKEFDSTGLRCCSTDCERRYLKRCENEQLMAAVGMERPVKRKCEAPGCGRDIPNWRNGRRVSKATRFCSDKCSKASKGPVQAPIARTQFLTPKQKKRPHKMGLPEEQSRTVPPPTSRWEPAAPHHWAEMPDIPDFLRRAPIARAAPSPEQEAA
jgi:hypothetical protein